MHTQLTAALDAPDLQLSSAGGKGANLNAMLLAGFPVPPGFVVLTEAYWRFVADNALETIIAQQWQLCDLARPDTFELAARRCAWHLQPVLWRTTWPMQSASSMQP